MQACVSPAEPSGKPCQGSLNHGLLEGAVLPKATYKNLVQKCVPGQGIEPAWLLTSLANDIVSSFRPPPLQFDMRLYVGLGMTGNAAVV